MLVVVLIGGRQDNLHYSSFMCIISRGFLFSSNRWVNLCLGI
jgi:hypothetical protein